MEGDMGNKDGVPLSYHALHTFCKHNYRQVPTTCGEMGQMRRNNRANYRKSGPVVQSALLQYTTSSCERDGAYDSLLWCGCERAI